MDKDNKLRTMEGHFTSVQVSNMGPITGTFNIIQRETVKRPFLVKNITEDNITATITTLGGDTLETVFFPGWNPELVVEVSKAPDGLQYGY